MNAHFLDWTESARQRLNDYLDEREVEAGEDTEARRDLRENLTLHIQEELALETGRQVTLAKLETILARLGVHSEVLAQHTMARENTNDRTPRPRRGVLLTFGVIFPALIFLWEFFTGMCGSVFFTPLESWFHILFIAVVIVGNAWLLTKQSEKAPLKWRALLAGVIVVSSGFFAFLFLPLVTLSVLTLIFYGMGLLSLTPIFCFMASRGIATIHRQSASPVWKTYWQRGAYLTLALFCLYHLPALWTRIAMAQAVSANESTSERGISQLRAYHHQDTLLRACYEGNRGTTLSTDISGWLMDGWQIAFPFLWQNDFRSFNSEQVREVFYRATGKAYNSLQPPSFVTTGSTLMGRSQDAWNDMQWDDHLGDDQVAVRLKDLDLHTSRMDGHLDAASGLAYLEWTFIFQNDAPREQEARMQILLPQDGVVSRLTLWVNDEPREAAFASKAQVRKAYQSVAVRQNRDPVLVTATGPDRVLVQCYPVPREGGLMKIRLGITAPLHNGKLSLPAILERNFGIPPKLETPLWLQSSETFAFAKKAAHPDGPSYSLQTKLPSAELQGSTRRFSTKAQISNVVWCEDPFASPDESHLQRTLIKTTREPLDKCYLVIDGSVSLAPYRDWLSSTISQLGKKVEVVIADDGIQRNLSKHRFRGGCDNGPALEWALTQAKSHPRSAVVWIHGPQPTESQTSEALIQLLERGSIETPLYSISLELGGNRLLEKLFKFRAVRSGPRDKKEFEQWLDSLIKGGEILQAQWSRSPKDSEPLGQKVSHQLAREWAKEKVQNQSRQQNPDSASIALAAKYQLVTAYSGAVVLETQEQYLQHGLQPVDASTVPNIPSTPEPSTALFVLFTALLSLTHRRRS